MIFLRSLLFNVLFFVWLFSYLTVCLPVLFLPRTYGVKVAKIGGQGVLWLCEYVMGIHLNLVGYENLPKTPVIVASKHQSTWETMAFFDFLVNPTIVLKRELAWIPVFGWYVKGLGMLTVARSRGQSSKDFKKFLHKAAQAVQRGEQILIFPEGTRSLPGQKGIYHSGVSSLYMSLDIPVVPVAHNAGVFWPRRGFLKKPGMLTLEFLPPIQPGLSRQEFMRTLEEKIESRSQTLFREATLAEHNGDVKRVFSF